MTHAPPEQSERAIPQPGARTGEDGFTLVELLVAITMMVVISGATVSLFISTVKNQSRITSRADQVGDSRIAIRNMVDDIRQASAILATPAPSATTLGLTTYVHASSCGGAPSVTAPALLCNVTYKCALETAKTTYACTRTVQGGTAVKAVGGLSSGSVFTYTPTVGTAATYITVKLVLPSSGSTYTTTLENGAALRNSATNLGY